MSKIVLVTSCDGYKALYINEKLELVGRFELHNVLYTLAKKKRRVDSFKSKSVNEEWLEHWNEYPDKFEDCVLEGQEWSV